MFFLNYNNVLGIQRGSKALKNKWEKIKRNVKQRLAEEKKEIYKTGGGVVKTFKKIEYFDSIIELLGISATGLASNFDSDVVGKYNLFKIISS